LQAFSTRLRDQDVDLKDITIVGGGPVGLSTLAVAVGEETDTLEDVYEPYLIQIGFLRRTPRGRAGWLSKLNSPAIKCSTSARLRRSWTRRLENLFNGIFPG
jgi:hypothetical protein